MGVLSRIKEVKNKSAFDFSFPYNVLSVFLNPHFFVRRGLYINIKQYAPIIRGKLLDFGCGCKPYEELFKNVDKYIGVDIEQSGHDHKNEKIDVFYDGKKLPFSDGSFDSIFSSEVFEHVPNSEVIFSELNRVLKKGGYMIASVPFVWNEHEIPYDYQRYTSYGLCNKLEEFGFEIKKVVKSTGYIEMLFQMWNEYLRHSFAKLSVGRFFTILVQFVFILPSTLIGILVNSVLPNNDSFFGDSIVICRKAKDV